MSAHIIGRIDNRETDIEVFSSCRDVITVVVPLPAGKHSLMHVQLNREELREFLARTMPAITAAEEVFGAETSA